MSDQRKPLRIVLGDDPFDVKIFLGERELISEGLMLSDLKFYLDHTGKRSLILQSEFFEFSGEVSEFEIRCRKILDELRPDAKSFSETVE